MLCVLEDQFPAVVTSEKKTTSGTECAYLYFMDCGKNTIPFGWIWTWASAYSSRGERSYWNLWISYTECCSNFVSTCATGTKTCLWSVGVGDWKRGQRFHLTCLQELEATDSSHQNTIWVAAHLYTWWTICAHSLDCEWEPDHLLDSSSGSFPLMWAPSVSQK